MLVTLSGATSATLLITQFVKGYFTKIPTQFVSYVIALVILAVGTAATEGAAPWHEWAIIPLDAIIVSLSSNGAFSAATRIIDSKK